MNVKSERQDLKKAFEYAQYFGQNFIRLTL
jgi:hypothetical protein